MLGAAVAPPRLPFAAGWSSGAGGNCAVAGAIAATMARTSAALQ
jgi:hypothetical protein